VTQDLVIVGAGGFARETAAAVEAINAVAPTWRLLGFLDDSPDLHGTTRSGVPILGGVEAKLDALAVVCVVSPRNFIARQQIAERLTANGQRFATLIHPSAQIDAGSTIGAGSVLLAQVVITADAVIGDHVLVMPQVVITHDDVIGDYATITSGVRLGGAVRVGAGAYLGSGSAIRESVVLGARSMIGMGSVVLTDVPAGQVWVGNPARYLRDVAAPVSSGAAHQ
jgi:sugar O-acyltransferase (sialic acid O-acetyltransferase NeuD family)